MSNLLNPSLDFFAEPLDDTSIENKEYQVYNPNDIGTPGTTKIVNGVCLLRRHFCST